MRSCEQIRGKRVKKAGDKSATGPGSVWLPASQMKMWRPWLVQLTGGKRAAV